MATRHSARQTAGRRRAAAGIRATRSVGKIGYRRSLRFEPLEDRRLLAVVTVDTDQDIVDLDDGVLSLREAIFATNTVLGADTIQFAESLTADGPATILLTEGELKITDELTIQGPGASLLAIDAQQQSRVFNITATTGDFTFAGLTITGGRTTGDGRAEAGGGIRLLIGGTLTIDQCTVSDNSTAGRFADGGGIYARNGNVTFTESTVSENYTAGDFAYGGGICARYGNVTLTESTVAGNSTTGQGSRGGGMWTRGDVTLIESSVSGNSTAGDLADGGGIHAYGEVTLTESTVSGNRTAGDNAIGGGVFCVGDVTLTQSTLSGNSTAGDRAHGGGIRTRGDVTLTESTISGNSTAGDLADGGGVFCVGDVTLTHSTVSGNSSAGIGGGVWARDNIMLDHTLLAGNTAAAGSPDLRPGVGALSVHYSLIGDNAGTLLVEAPVGLPDANGNLIGGAVAGAIDPLLGDLADNGGPTMTHALLADSAAVNAGNLNAMAGVDGVPEFDQRGEPFGRVVGGRIDIGAVEYQTPTDLKLLVDTLVDESDGDYSRGDLSLREAIELANSNDYEGVVDTVHFDPILSGGTILLTQGELKITDDLTIQGLGASLLSIDASGSDPTPDVNDGLGTHVLSVRGQKYDTHIAVELSDLKLTGADKDSEGGALYAKFSNLDLVDCTITGNSSRSGGGMFVCYSDVTMIGGSVSDNESGFGTSTLRGGGGIGSASSNLTLDGVEVIGNSTAGYGGGLAQSGGALTILNTVISGNVAAVDGSPHPLYPFGGGGIGSGGRFEFADQTLIVRDSQITGNSTLGSGGGIYFGGLGSNSVVISGTTISDNAAGGNGGGILARSEEVRISDAVVADNSAAGSGGGIASVEFILQGTGSVSAPAAAVTQLAGNTPDDYELIVQRSTISGNSAGRSGGGIYTLNQSAAIVATTVSGNTSGETGGGLAGSEHSAVPAAMMLLNSTVSGNLSDGDGGGIYLIGLASDTHALTSTTLAENSARGKGGGLFLARGTLEIDHTIVAENAAVLGRDLTGLLGTTINARYSLVGDNSGTGLTPAPVGSPDENGNLVGGSTRFTRIDPELSSLANNGGPTMTHTLWAHSPAIDAGDPDAMPDEDGVPVFDQRGAPFTRVYGGRIDIGAVELQPPGVLLGDYNQDGTVDAADYVVWRDEMSAVVADGALDDLYADGNGDGVINDWDYRLWRNNFGSVLADVAVSGSGAFAPPSALVIERSAPLPETPPPPAAPSAITVRKPVLAAGRRVNTADTVRQDQLLSAWVASRLRGNNRWDQDSTLVRGRRQGGEDDGAGAYASVVDRVFRGIGVREDLPLAGLRRGRR